MRILEYHIEEIKTLLIQVLNIFNSLEDADFDDQLKTAKLKMDQVSLIKKELRKHFKSEELMLYEENLYNIAKQIEERFDNIVKRKSLEKKAIAHKIGQLQNSKKLQNYRR
jgi:hypothetical protein